MLNEPYTDYTCRMYHLRISYPMNKKYTFTCYLSSRKNFGHLPSPHDHMVNIGKRQNNETNNSKQMCL